MNSLKNAASWSRRQREYQYLLGVAVASCGGLHFWYQSHDEDDGLSFFSTPSTQLEKAAPALLARRNTPILPLPTRAQQIANLKASVKDKKPFDVLVVGGGATGAGAALDAQTRGLSTALIERGDFGNETSARSTKLIWAGIR